MYEDPAEMDKMGSIAAVFSIIYIYFIGNCLSVNFNLIAADANQGNVSIIFNS